MPTILNVTWVYVCCQKMEKKKKKKTCENARFSEQQLKQSLIALTFIKRGGAGIGVNRKVNMKVVLWPHCFSKKKNNNFENL